MAEDEEAAEAGAEQLRLELERVEESANTWDRGEEGRRRDNDGIPGLVKN